MILKQRKINGVPLYVPFNKLGDEYRKLDLYKEFKATAGNREISISRADFWNAPSPMATQLISDEAMQNIAEEIALELGNDMDDFDDDRFEEIYWEVAEAILIRYGVPYYEDDKISNYSIGDEVFLVNEHGGAYGTISDINEDEGYVVLNTPKGSDYSDISGIYKKYGEVNESRFRRGRNLRESRLRHGRMLREGRRHFRNRMMKERYMSDEDIEGQYSDWWLMSISVNAEDNPYQRRENVYLTTEIAFPNSDEEDFDSYRVVGYEKDEDGSVHQYTDVWLPEDVAEDMYNLAVRILSEWKPGDEKIFKSPEEFRSWYKTLR